MKVTAEYLERTFRAYFETMVLCVNGRAYWALLHVLVVMPDVCAAIERGNGEADYGAYRKWCKRFLCVSDPVMTPQDWYRVRCMLLHQGRSRESKGQSQYDHFQFGHPKGDEIVTNVARNVAVLSQKSVIDPAAISETALNQCIASVSVIT